MAEICCGVVSQSKTSTPCEASSRVVRRRRMDIRRLKFVANLEQDGRKRQKLDACRASFSRECENAVENCASDDEQHRSETENGIKETRQISISNQYSIIPSSTLSQTLSPVAVVSEVLDGFPKFGFASVCGRRRDMEDAVAVHPSLCGKEDETTAKIHYYGVYDGHGCSHVAMKCRDRLHELVKEELENREASTEWKIAMEKSFSRMDKEVIAWNGTVMGASCRCELQTPECDTVGSTAVVAIVTPDRIIVANCGDSRAVLCRSGKAIPLSSDHKPDRPDELLRIQSAGGRVIYWEGPRVLGVLAMSRAIGDNYLKPYVSCEPEVTITDRTDEDECLILASDGLWDVVSNDTACGVARMCLRGKAPTGSSSSETEVAGGESSDRACSDASMLLMKLALARQSTDNVSVIVVDLRRDT